MTTEKLKSQISKYLEVADSEKNLAFSIFKKKIAEYLEVDEAIKIPGIGVFQLKEQFTADKEKLTSSKGKTTLLFSPIEKNDDESLFLTLDLDDTNGNSMEFDEKVFNIGIDKPIMPIGDKQQGNTEQLSIDKKISEIIAESEKIKNFDLWDDYLTKQAASILPDEMEEIDIDSYLQSEETGPSEDDFMELDEDELLAEFENSELLDNDDFSVVDDEPEITNAVEDETIIDLTEKSIEPANEILEDIPIDSDEIISSMDDIEEIDNLDEDGITHKSDDSIFYEEVAENKSTSEEEIKQEVEEISTEQNEPKDNVAEESDMENSNDVLPIIEEEEKTIKNKSGKKMALKKKNVVHNRPYSPTIYALIAAFFIVGGIGIYYLFFNNPTWLYDQNEIEVKLSEKHQREYEEAKRLARLQARREDSLKNLKAKEDSLAKLGENTENKNSENNDVKVAEKEPKQNIVSQEKEKTAIKEKVVASTKEKAIVDNNKPVTHKKVSTPKIKKTGLPKNVFYNGSEYSIQLSSWPKKELAEKEVNRLKNMGYDAYIMKAFIPKYNKNWYRVRIGNLATIDEVKRVQQEIK